METKLTPSYRRALAAPGLPDENVLRTTTRGNTSTVAVTLAACFLAVSPVLGYWYATAPGCSVIVTTYSGDTYVAGEGDTCTEAMHGAVIPDSWREIRFE